SYSFFFSSRRRHTRFSRDWSSDVCSSDLTASGSPTPCPRPICSTTHFSPDSPVWPTTPAGSRFAGPAFERGRLLTLHGGRAHAAAAVAAVVRVVPWTRRLRLESFI